MFLGAYKLFLWLRWARFNFDGFDFDVSGELLWDVLHEDAFVDCNAPLLDSFALNCGPSSYVFSNY